jgi:hypothetical protein
MSERDGHLPPDRQTERTRWELIAIMVIVAVVLLGSFAWRAFGHHPASTDRTAWNLSNQTGGNRTSTSVVATPAAVAPPHAP